MDKENPHKGHRQRVREKILINGLNGLQPHEILEFLLFHTVAQKDTNPIAHKLISTFGSLENVLEASAEELMEKGNLSFNSAVLLSSVKGISMHYHKLKKEKTPIDSISKLKELFAPYFAGQQSERLIVAFLDSGLRVRSVKEFADGQENSFRVNARDIVRDAIVFNAYNVAIAHNHPVSSAKPSKNDINTTSEIKNQLEFFDVKLIDHIIFGVDGSFSFAGNENYNCFISEKGE